MNRGSEWRKWDLHFHTPASPDYQNKSVTAQEIVDGLLRAGIEVVAISGRFFRSLIADNIIKV